MVLFQLIREQTEGKMPILPSLMPLASNDSLNLFVSVSCSADEETPTENYGWGFLVKRSLHRHGSGGGI